MHNTINNSKGLKGNITWQEQPHLAYCASQFEVIAHLVGDALKRVFNCASLEAQ